MGVYIKIDDVAKAIGLSPSTIKKYYLMVEDYGYRFARNNQGQLIFSDQDINMFRKIIQLKNEPNMSVQKAVEKVVSSITSITVYNESSNSSNSYNIDLLSDDINEIKEFIKVQAEVNKSLLTELQDTKKYIANRLEERDQTLMLALKETMETKKLISDRQNKKWWQIFKKSHNNHD
jgi:DNA-binding transcriptional MerR regulator